MKGAALGERKIFGIWCFGKAQADVSLKKEENKLEAKPVVYDEIKRRSRRQESFHVAYSMTDDVNCWKVDVNASASESRRHVIGSPLKRFIVVFYNHPRIN